MSASFTALMCEMLKKTRVENWALCEQPQMGFALVGL